MIQSKPQTNIFRKIIINIFSVLQLNKLPIFSLYYQKKHKQYELVIKVLQEKVRKGTKLNVCFYVMFDSVFTMKPLFELMLKDEIFEPYITVIPCTNRGFDFMITNLEKTYKSLSSLYNKDKIFLGYNHTDLSELNTFSSIYNYDIICFSNLYESATMKEFRLEYLKNKPILPIYCHYSILNGLKTDVTYISKPIMNKFWRIFTETNYSYNLFKKYQILKAKNVVLSGYCKLDDLAKITPGNRNRRKIIIAPHYSVRNIKSSHSAFLLFADFFLKLPTIYPEIDFIFRPHPLLFPTLESDDIWGNEKTKKYFAKLLSYNNVSLSEGVNYYDIFVNSDAMIHDCGSFIAEYLITGKPCCYMILNEKILKNIFSDFGRKCLSFYHKAYNENDILSFINNLSNDTEKQNRFDFVKKELLVNYSDVANVILNNIKKSIRSGDLRSPSTVPTASRHP